MILHQTFPSALQEKLKRYYQPWQPWYQLSFREKLILGEGGRMEGVWVMVGVASLPYFAYCYGAQEVYNQLKQSLYWLLERDLLLRDHNNVKWGRQARLPFPSCCRFWVVTWIKQNSANDSKTISHHSLLILEMMLLHTLISNNNPILH